MPRRVSQLNADGIFRSSDSQRTAVFLNCKYFIDRAVFIAGPTGANMRTHKLFFSVFVLSLVAILSGCGSSVTFTAGQNPPPVTGPYTNANLNGTYAFLIRGTNTSFFTIAGSFQANGAGMITGGVEDINSPGTANVVNNVAITGTYSVLADGRTTATINSTAGNFVLDFVLLSNQHALAIRFNNSATASGTIDLQDSTAFSATALQGSFAFSLSGADHSGNIETTAGAFTTLDVSNADVIQVGVQDINDNGTLTLNHALTGSLASPAAGRGTATLTTSVGAMNFVYYVVDANHLILIETDVQPVLAGNAFRQAATTISGTLVFTASGSSGTVVFTAGGILNSDANNNVLATSTEDVNKAGTVTQNISISGTYSAIVNGRGTITLPGSNGLQSLVVYPTTGGFLIMSIDGSNVASGTAFTRTIATPSNASINGRYGFSLAGSNNAGPVDAIAQFTADGKGNLTGNLDENSAGTLGSGLALTGTYSLPASGRGTAVFNSTAGAMNLILYMVGASDFIYLETDTGQVATGRIVLQQ
jgi:hypothetical protein